MWYGLGSGLWFVGTPDEQGWVHAAGLELGRDMLYSYPAVVTNLTPFLSDFIQTHIKYIAKIKKYEIAIKKTE